MTDSFALLHEPRRPWMDTDELKRRFLEASAAGHPDRFHGAGEAEREESARRYAGVNTAYQLLRDPRTRLLHLLELELGAPPRDIQRIPAGTMELFAQIGQACRDADAFLAERTRVTSPMLKVRLFQQGLEWVERLKGLQDQVKTRAATLEGELQTLNDAWSAAPPPGDPGRRAALPLDRLEEIYRGFSYVGRWTEQIQERLVQLASA